MNRRSYSSKTEPTQANNKCLEKYLSLFILVNQLPTVSARLFRILWLGLNLSAEFHKFSRFRFKIKRVHNVRQRTYAAQHKR